MVPFTRLWRARNPSSAWVSTSTSALPIPTTSSSRESATAPLALRGKVAIEQHAEPLAGARRERLGIGDHRAGQRIAAAAGAGLAHARDDAPEDDLRGGHVLPQVGHDRLH